MCQDAAKASTGLISFQRLYKVVIEEPDSPDLRKEKKMFERTEMVLFFVISGQREKERPEAHLVRFDRSR